MVEKFAPFDVSSGRRQKRSILCAEQAKLRLVWAYRLGRRVTTGRARVTYLLVSRA